MRRPALLATMLLLALPGLAGGQGSAPPGNSGISQYYETVPAAGGGKPPGKGSTPALPSTTIRRLAQSGANGKALAQALSTAPGPPAARRAAAQRSRASRGAKPTRPDADRAFRARSRQPSAPAASLAQPVLGDGGPSASGPLLPIFLLVTALGATVLGVRRLNLRRSRG